MSRMSDYCKAYPVSRFRAFAQWTENTDALAPLPGNANGRDAGTDAGPDDTPRVLGDDDVLFLHDNYRVTVGVFVDEQIVFDQDSPDWRAFCADVLEFAVPDYLLEPADAPAETTSDATA